MYIVRSTAPPERLQWPKEIHQQSTHTAHNTLVKRRSVTYIYVYYKYQTATRKGTQKGLKRVVMPAAIYIHRCIYTVPCRVAGCNAYNAHTHSKPRIYKYENNNNNNNKKELRTKRKKKREGKKEKNQKKKKKN